MSERQAPGASGSTTARAVTGHEGPDAACVIAPTARSRYTLPMRSHLLTSRDLAPAGAKAIDLAPGQTLVLCDLPGPGRIVRVWMTLPVTGQRAVLARAVVRMFWDDEAEPSVDVPLGALFGATFNRPVPFTSRRVTIAGGGYLCAFDMPFSSRARIELYNPSDLPVRKLFWQIGWQEASPGPVATFHAALRHEVRRAGEPPFTLARARGAGRLAGVKVDLQGEGWWLRPPWRDVVLPRGFGLGFLEGWERVTIDGHSWEGTGGEDYFGGGFYFMLRTFSTPTHGCTRVDPLTARASAYRLYEDDPLPFDAALDLTLDHGLHNSMAASCTAVNWWYQHEPHEPLPALAPWRERQHSTPWVSLAHWAVIAATVAGVGAILGWVLQR